MSQASIERQQRLRAVISDFLQERLTAKLEKLEKEWKKDDLEFFESKKAELLDQHEMSSWIKDAVRRATQLKLVTHIVKAAHPDAKGTDLFCLPEKLPPVKEVSSHHLKNPAHDVVGNAGALDVYTFLTLSIDGSTLIELMESRDVDLAAILGSEPKIADQWMSDFIRLKNPQGTPSSHTLAKQVYWLTGDDPLADANYHLLAPLYATSLTQYVFDIIQNDKFGEDAKIAREARNSHKYSELPLHDYPDLAVQKLGGSKPQNISKLNALRRGDNFLLASLPPQWDIQNIRPPFGISSIFDIVGKRKSVKHWVKELKSFLESNPPKNIETRNKRQSLLFEIIDEVRFYTDSILTLPPGWSSNDRCTLQDAQKLWLDPGRAKNDSNFAQALATASWQDAVSSSFGNWVNSQLNDKLIFSDTEYQFWADVFSSVDWSREPLEQGTLVSTGAVKDD